MFMFFFSFSQLLPFVWLFKGIYRKINWKERKNISPYNKWSNLVLGQESHQEFQVVLHKIPLIFSRLVFWYYGNGGNVIYSYRDPDQKYQPIDLPIKTHTSILFHRIPFTGSNIYELSTQYPLQLWWVNHLSVQLKRLFHNIRLMFILWSQFGEVLCPLTSCCG